MSRMRAIARSLLKTPGLTAKDIAAAIGQQTKAEQNCIAAALCTMAQAGRVYHNNRPARSGQRRWYANATALDDQRLTQPTRARTATRSDPDIQRKRPAPIKGALPKPPKGRDMEIIRKPPPGPAARYSSTAAGETVEQWMQRTGQQPQSLPPHACSKPLRYDYTRSPGAVAQSHLTGPRRAKAGAL